jgi:hypothetical protein
MCVDGCTRRLAQETPIGMRAGIEVGDWGGAEEHPRANAIVL